LILLENYLFHILEDTTGYIESHLFDELTLDSISAHVNLSKFHLLRIWKGATGTGLMEYVRRRRIASSLTDLLNLRRSIDALAAEFGFGSERTFNRVFKEEFNTTPARWRRHPVAFNILDRFNADFMHHAGEGLVFLKNVRVQPAFNLAGIQYEVDVQDDQQNQTANRLAVEFFYQQRPKVVNPVAKDVYYGYSAFSHPGATRMHYQPSIQVDAGSIIPPGMTVKRVPPHKYGVFTYMGLHRPEEISSRHLQGLLDFVENQWMPTVEFRLQENFRLELIDYARCSKQYCECDLYFPIERL
jgi:AraC family transcriptional regulator